MCTNLSPSQNMAARSVSQNLEFNGIAVLKCGNGMGRSTILRQLHTDHGGDLLGLPSFHAEIENQRPFGNRRNLQRHDGALFAWSRSRDC